MSGLLAITTYLVYVVAFDARRWRRLGPVACVAVQRVAGGVLLGGVAAWAGAGLHVPDVGRAAVWCALAVVAVPVVFFASRKPETLARRPDIRVAERWSVGLVATSLVLWVVYLVPYELFFRGVVLDGLVGAWGPLGGAAGTTVLYALAHVPQGRDETVGSLVLGAALAVATLHADSVVPAVVVHVAISWTNVLASLWWSDRLPEKSRREV